MQMRTMCGTILAAAMAVGGVGWANAAAGDGSCSQGGQDGVREAQRYTADYDGIIAGVPTNLRLSIAAYFRHVYRLTHDAEGRLLFTPEQIAPQPFGRLQLQRDAGDARDGH